MIAKTLHPSKILYVGMDIHKETHAVYASDCFGREHLKEEIKNSEDGFDQLVQSIGKLSNDFKLTPIFGLEDTGGNGHRLANFLSCRGYFVKSVNPVLVTRQRTKTIHPEKNDLQDAKGVAKVLIHEGIDTLPTYSVSEKTIIAKNLRNLVNDRTFLIKEQTRLKNNLHVLLNDLYGYDYHKIFNNIFSVKALQFFLLDVEKRKGNSEEEIVASQIARKIRRLESVRLELKEIQAQLKKLVERTKTHLETIPGCGLVTAATILAEVQDIKRFDSSAKLAKYAGLAPREKSSGKTKNMFKSKSGNRRLKGALHTIGLSQISRFGSEIGKQYYQRKLAEGKTKMQSLAHLKRRLVDIVYLMLKNETQYQAPIQS